MTDLRKGIIDLGEITITPHTTKDDLLLVYGEKLNTNMSTSTFLDFNRLFHVDNDEFMIMFSFNTEGKIRAIQLWPTVQYKSESWDRTGRQEERRQFCDKWLFERLGEPVKISESVTLYEYEELEVYSFSHFDLRNGADAGYIVISYK